jgi:hypothetical protein
MPNEIDNLQIVGLNTQGYSGWILTPSGVALHSTLDAIAETLTNVGQNRVGYSAWVRQPSGVNVPAIDEVILGVPETEETVTCIGTAIHTIEEVIVGTPVPEPEPIPVPAVGGGTIGYAPIFEQIVPRRKIKETVTNVSKALFASDELTTVSDDLTVVVVNSHSFEGRYRRQTFVAVPVMPDIDLPPKEIFVTHKFPDERFSGLTAEQKRKKTLKQMILLDLI